ncbi:Aste57867_3877 [Aphanomyces stellatus]|uniref:Aste57867_3877 protein n=1 Tax=Aphanomyces stellatus TaxID=120398 RepID=A0A485KAI7_9STRA|nr:hypothetical protein As57867_003866 [Aphanomyces stellatus]VFT81022.1 Aste57867_3877 [Aphanomyces stellatus]
MSNYSDLLALSDLLKPNDDGESYNDAPKVTPCSITAGSLPKEAINRPIGQIVQEDPKSIWSNDEVKSDDEDEEGDTRKRPKHEILFKQDVMTEDIFLGLGDKDPSVAHCDAMVIKIAFPGHVLQEIDLDFKSQKLIAQSHKLKLSIFLPNPVKHKEGKAKWDSKIGALVVTLPILKDEW